MTEQFSFLDKVKPAIGTDNGLQLDLDGNTHYFESTPTEHIEEAGKNLIRHKAYQQAIEDWRSRPR